MCVFLFVCVCVWKGRVGHRVHKDAGTILGENGVYGYVGAWAYARWHVGTQCRKGEEGMPA